MVSLIFIIALFLSLPQLTVANGTQSEVKSSNVKKSDAILAVGTRSPTKFSSRVPSRKPTTALGASTTRPTGPSRKPTRSPSAKSSRTPTILSTESPSENPTIAPTESPSLPPTFGPTEAPTFAPTFEPTVKAGNPTFPPRTPTGMPFVPGKQPSYSPGYIAPTPVPVVAVIPVGGGDKGGSSSSSSGTSAGTIAGAVIGALAGVALLAGGGYYIYRQNEQKRRQPTRNEFANVEEDGDDHEDTYNKLHSGGFKKKGKANVYDDEDY